MKGLALLLALFLTGCARETATTGQAGPLQYLVRTSVRSCRIDQRLPVELLVTNTSQDTLYFIDFGDHRNCEMLPYLEFIGSKNGPWRSYLPLAAGEPKPLPRNSSKKGGFSIVKLAPSKTYRVQFSDVLTSDARKILRECDLPKEFVLSFRWSKGLWRNSETWPFDQKNLFVSLSGARKGSEMEVRFLR